MKPRHLEILQHARGYDRYGHGSGYRNHFVTGPGSDDFADCNELVQLGFMHDYGAKKICGGDHCFVVTADGEVAIRQHSPKPPKLSRDRKRYLHYLAVGDCFDGFKDYLKRRGYAATDASRHILSKETGHGSLEARNGV